MSRLHHLTTRLGILPEYTELSLFAISVTLIALFMLSSEARYDFGEMWSTMANAGYGRGFIGTLMIGLVLIGGFFVTIYHIFFQRPMYSLEKSCVLFYALIMNMIIAVRAAYAISQSDQSSILYGFPLWNLIHAGLLLLLLRIGVINERNISDVQTRMVDAGLTVVVIILIVVLMQFYFKSDWGITASLALTYTTTVAHTINEKIYTRVRHI